MALIELAVSPGDDWVSVTAYEVDPVTKKRVPSLVSFEAYERVHPPNALLALLGDTFDARIDRAKDRVARKAGEILARRRRADAAAKRAAGVEP